MNKNIYFMFKISFSNFTLTKPSTHDARDFNWKFRPSVFINIYGNFVREGHLHNALP